MNKTVLVLGVVSILTYSVPTTPVKAISNNNSSTVSDENISRTAGLLSNCYITVSSGAKKIVINGKTQAISSMKSIGFKDIVVEYSNDNSHWNVENDNIADLLKSDSSSYNLYSHEIDVKGGYYYRVKLNHYAKEKGFTGSSQSVENISDSVWID